MKEIIDILLEDPIEAIKDFIGCLCLLGGTLCLYFLLWGLGIG